MQLEVFGEMISNEVHQEFNEPRFQTTKPRSTSLSCYLSLLNGPTGDFARLFSTGLATAEPDLCLFARKASAQQEGMAMMVDLLKP